jgi:large subunit ribosomal protein L19
MDWLKLVHGVTKESGPAPFAPGDEVRVWYRILEQGRERLGQFEGTVIRYRGSGSSKTFTIRRVTYGEGVERVFPVDSKTISRIEVLRQGKVKRSRLYFLRSAIGKTRIASAGQSVSPASVANKPADAEASAEQSQGAVSALERPAESIPPRA